MMKSGLSLRAYLVILVLGTTLPLVALLAWFIYHDAAISTEREAGAALHLAENNASYISSFLSHTRLAIEMLAQRHSSTLLDPRHCKTVVTDWFSYSPHYANLLVRDHASNPVCAVFEGAGLSQLTPDHESFEQAVRENRFVIGKPVLGAILKRWVVHLRQPIHDAQDRVIGVISVPIDLVKYRFTADDLETPKRAITRIVDEAGTVIASSIDPEHWVGRNALDTPAVGVMLAQKQGTASAVGIDGSERIFGFTMIPGTRWFISSSIPAEIIFAETRPHLFRVMLVTVVILCLVLVFSYFFARAITTPMKAIATTANAVASGNPNVRTLSGGPREVATVATQFNAMLDAQMVTHRQLHESEARLKQLVKMSSDWLWEQDADFRFTAVFQDDPMQRIIPEKEVIGKTRWEIPHAGVTAEQVGQHNALLKARQPFRNFEYQRIGPDGEARCLSITGEPLFDAQGNFKGYRGVGTDITERKRVEEKLRESEDRYRDLVEHSQDLICTHDLDGRILSVNPWTAKILGYEQAELVNMNLRDVLAPSVRHEFDGYLAAIRAHGVAKGLMLVQTRTGGKRLWDYNNTLRSVGVPTSIVRGMAHDISERHLAEKALRESEERLSGIIRTAMHAIIMVDEDMHIVLFNPAAEKIFGYSSADITGTRLDRLIPERFRHTHHQNMRTFGSLQTSMRKMSERAGINGLRANGEEFPAEASISHLTLNGKKLYTVILADITERKRNDEALRGAGKRLRELSHRLQEAGETERRAISRELHDRIGQGLTTLTLMVGALDARLSAEARSAIGTKLRDMRTLLRSLVVHVRNVMAELRPPVLDDYGLFAALRHLTTEFSNRTGIAVNISGADLNPRLPTIVETVMYRISQETLNNTAKHAQAKKVKISLNAVSERVVLDIADDGIGFNANHMPHRGKHWGIITMHERAEAVGIAFRLESAPGAGTRVVLEAERAAS